MERNLLSVIPQSTNFLRTNIIHSKCIIPKVYVDDNLQLRESYPQSILDIIKIVSLSGEILPVGSATYQAYQYPSDVDLFEPYVLEGELNEVRLQLVSMFQDIACKVIYPLFWSDFKAGSDDRFSFYLGRVQDGELVDYNKDIINNEIVNLLCQNLISEEEYNNMVILNEKIHIGYKAEDFYQLRDILRDLTTVRWNRDDVLNGFKILRGNKKYYLYDALISKSIVKLDIYAPIEYINTCSKTNIRYTEVTNWFLLEQVINGQTNSLSAELQNYDNSLRSDVREFIYDNPLKASKRLWSLAAYKKKSQTGELRNVDIILDKLTPLAASYIALLNSSMADIETIINIIEGYNGMYTDNDILGSLDAIMERLLCYDGNDKDVIFNNKLYNKLVNVRNNFSIPELEEIINMISGELRLKIRQYFICQNIDLYKMLNSI
ncbi:Sputnik V21 virophage-like protein [Orpheovirus IHUMI-LCC2]|uniref:Sputnik V21 virophage-like protein n=1 Tax=Orpheovirus IHUMI-LCC2 TaxID=2023057 RepID=A0A2I2L5A0_9VIRU|nr:Sputnik V21 virophage-like protein [Orpheovirus IHUMI-LCC2]SNW62680.1 Sputnik V21 virophage-like protein [Orpheovirus IHUMI-LCC2]